MPTRTNHSFSIEEVLSEIGISPESSGVSTGSEWLKATGYKVVSVSPVDGLPVATVTMADVKDYDRVIEVAQAGFQQWRKWTAPHRGEVVRQFGDLLRKYKDPLGTLVSYEMGKSLQEGKGRSAGDD